ncbi:thiamine pyrophosphate-binding protein [Herbidospora cretacea]|uniref:thiamine pyrophosphate-binding protein n=1 Tax=Herbidospora cretacea TaxID=28444 RepID=UPI000554546B|nr:thiamine pyrophosphate-binding protein [Herbidospora cretacea]
MTGATAVAATLAAHGVDTVFGIPGTHNLALYDALARQGTRLVTPRHEQGAGYAADGYARISGRPGVVLTTTGPGILNAAAAAGQAYSDSIPLLLISPGVPTTHPRRSTGYLHETKNQSAAMDAVCAWSHRVTTVAEIPSALAAAFTFFAEGRPRPVHIEIPADLLDAEGAYTLPARGGLPEAALALVEAGRVGLVLGGGARHAGEAALRLADLVDALVVTTINGTGILPPAHPRNLGPALFLKSAQAWLKSCDVVVAVGTELAPSDLWTDFTYEGTLIRIDVDPAQTTSATIPIPTRAESALPALATLVANTMRADQTPSTGSDLPATIRDAGDEQGVAIGPPTRTGPDLPAILPDTGGEHGVIVGHPTRTGPSLPAITRDADGERGVVVGYAPGTDSARPGRDRGEVPGRVSLVEVVRQVARERAALAAPWRAELDAIAQALPARAVVAADNSMFCYYGALAALRHRFLFPTGFGTLGYALPAAIGAKVADPGLPVLVLAGDGALQFSVQELATAVELGLSLPVVVAVNGGYGEIRAEMKARPMTPVAVDLHAPDFVQLARAFGARGVDRPADLGEEIGRAFAADRPTVIVVQEHS